MTDLQHYQAKKCLTAAGFLIHRNKVLLVKHKKVGYWLAPGGHLERDELPHQAAEREFWEETALTVKAINAKSLPQVVGSEYVPSPFASNLHWVAKENYETRKKSNAPEKRITNNPLWPRGCEQHLTLVYLVEPTDGVKFRQNVEETDGISFFSLNEVKELGTPEHILEEVEMAFELVK